MEGAPKGRLDFSLDLVYNSLRTNEEKYSRKGVVTMGELLALLITIAGIAFIFGGPKAAGRVLASPWSLFGWVLRSGLTALGRALVRVVSDAHNELYRRWPLQTVIAEVVLGAALLLTIIF